jgi:ATP-dependent DNA helicase RecG
MYYSKDIESFGTGLKRIATTCRETEVKVEFRMMKRGFAVVFYRPDEKFDMTEKTLDDPINDPINDPLNDPLNETQKSIIALLKKNNAATYDTLAVAVGVSAATIKRSLKNLQEMGVVKRVGSKKSGRWEIVETE